MKKAEQKLNSKFFGILRPCTYTACFLLFVFLRLSREGKNKWQGRSKNGMGKRVSQNTQEEQSIQFLCIGCMHRLPLTLFFVIQENTQSDTASKLAISLHCPCDFIFLQRIFVIIVETECFVCFALLCVALFVRFLKG